MALGQAKFPVTRHEELRYFTKTHQDTWSSVITVVEDNNATTEESVRSRYLNYASHRRQRLIDSIKRTISSCQPWCWKGLQLLSSLCRNWWLIELFCWCLGAICMIAIATVLAAWNGQPLPDRFPLGLKLNAYVSVFAAVAKLALAVCLEESLATQKYLWYTTKTPVRPLLDFERFELAARRPVGAVKLIWRLKTRSFATLGAVIFLLSLGLDPMFQQLLSFPSHASTENPSTVPRLVSFVNPIEVTGADGAVVHGADLTMRNVAPSFFRSREAEYSLNTFCPSASCVWPAFDTLSICSTCSDISHTLTHACLNESGSWRRDFNPEPPRTNVTRSMSCGWFFNATSDDPLLMTGYNLEGHGTLLSRHFPYHDTIQNDLYWAGSLLSKAIPQPLADFAFASNPNYDAVHRNETPQALSCTLRWCVKRVSASFSEGTYRETVVSTFTNDTSVSEPLSCKTLPDGTREWQYDGNVTLSPPNSSDTFIVEDNTMLTARFTIDLYIPNILIQPNATASIVAHYPLPTENDGPKTETSYNDLWLQPDEGAKIVDRMATRLTNALRNDPRFAQTVNGSGVFVTYVAVEWSFFTFPLVVLLLSLLLLIATIIQTYKKDVWKTSDLTTLVHGLSENAKLRLSEAQSMHEVRTLAGNMPVYLTAYDGGRRQLDIGEVEAKRPQ